MGCGLTQHAASTTSIGMSNSLAMELAQILSCVCTRRHRLMSSNDMSLSRRVFNTRAISFNTAGIFRRQRSSGSRTELLRLALKVTSSRVRLCFVFLEPSARVSSFLSTRTSDRMPAAWTKPAAEVVRASSYRRSEPSLQTGLQHIVMLRVA